MSYDRRGMIESHWTSLRISEGYDLLGPALRSALIHPGDGLSPAHWQSFFIFGKMWTPQGVNFVDSSQCSLMPGLFVVQFLSSGEDVHAHDERHGCGLALTDHRLR